MQLVPLYTGLRPINTKKLQDLQELLDFIPPVHHTFYNDLQSAADAHSASEEESSEDWVSLANIKLYYYLFNLHPNSTNNGNV